MWERCVCSDDLVVCISNLHAYVHPPAQLILLCQGILKKLESQFLVLSIESIAYVFVSSFCVFCTQVTAAPSAWDKAPPPPPPREDASLEPRDRICGFAHSFFWGCVFSFSIFRLLHVATFFSLQPEPWRVVLSRQDFPPLNPLPRRSATSGVDYHGIMARLWYVLCAICSRSS